MKYFHNRAMDAIFKLENGNERKRQSNGRTSETRNAAYHTAVGLHNKLCNRARVKMQP